jgi:oxalate decarboxylase
MAAATGTALATSSKAAGKTDEKEPAAGAAPSYKFRLQKAKAHTYEGGDIREHKASDFPASHNIAGAVAKLVVGGYREPHWHPNSDEWAYILDGKVRLVVVGPHGQTTVEDFEYGDTWFVPIGFGHAVLNIGDSEAQILLVHNHGEFTTIEVSEWVNGGPKEVFAAALATPETALDKVPKKKVFLGKTRKK